MGMARSILCDKDIITDRIDFHFHIAALMSIISDYSLDVGFGRTEVSRPPIENPRQGLKEGRGSNGQENETSK